MSESLRHGGHATVQSTTVARATAGLTRRAVIVSLVLGVVACIWSLESDSVLATCRVGEAVPPIPAIATVLLLVIVNVFSLRLLRRRLFDTADIGFAFTVTAIGAMFMSYGVLMYFYSFIMAFTYFATPENHLGDYQYLIPHWYQPRSAEVIRQFYESAPNGSIPWNEWMVPLGAWTLFLFALFGSALCMARLFHNDWSHRERLTFPIAQFVTSLADIEHPRAGARSLLLNPLTWIGVGVAALYNALNFSHSFNPTIPSLPSWLPLSRLFVEYPWTAFTRGGYGFAFKTSPLIMGIAYFVPLEQAVSVIFFTIFVRFANVVLTAAGYTHPSSPFTFQQAAGAYMAVFVFLLWSARHSIAACASRLVGLGQASDKDTPPAWALVGAVVGTAVVIAWMIASHMSAWMALIFMAMYVGFAVTYARARAEAGVPVLWVYPNYQHKEMILAMFGSKYLLDHGGPANVLLLWYYGFLSRGYLQSSMALHSDTFRIGEDTNSHPLTQTVAGIVGIVLAVLLGHYLILKACYTYGYNSMHATPLTVGMNAAMSVTSAIEYPTAPDRAKSLMGLFGVLTAGGLIWARRVWLRFPLHPLGYAMAMAYGNILWGPFLVAGFIKWVVLRVGGVGAYRRVQACFLGMVLGHALFGGIVGSLLQMYNVELFRRFMVDFG